MGSEEKRKYAFAAVVAAAIAGIGTGGVFFAQSRTPAGGGAFFDGRTEPRGREVDDGFVRLEGGAFHMGSPSSERQRQDDEASHRVVLGAFYIDPCEVTQQDYERITGKNPSVSRGGDLPVENVTWFDAIEYCNLLSERTGLEAAYSWSEDKRVVTWNRAADGYRLPTEAEWEYACRAGTTTPFNTGSRVHSETVNFHGSYPYLIEENYVRRRDASVVTSRNRGRTVAARELAPNAFGLHNMHGNVAEWVWDYYGEYRTDDVENPAGALSGALRVNRGGSYNDFGKHVRSAYRSASNPFSADRNLGFRVCRNGAGGSAAASSAVTTEYSPVVTMPEKPRILIAYFSYSGNTESAARLLREKTGGDVFEISMSRPYTGNIYEVSQRDLNAGVRPPIDGPLPDVSRYDVVLLGYPTWWATMPMPVLAFLESADFSGKTILPFSSHGGTMFGDSVSDLAKAALASYIGFAFEFTYSGGRDLSQRLDGWLVKNGIE